MSSESDPDNSYDDNDGNNGDPEEEESYGDHNDDVVDDEEDVVDENDEEADDEQENDDETAVSGNEDVDEEENDNYVDEEVVQEGIRLSTDGEEEAPEQLVITNTRNEQEGTNENGTGGMQQAHFNFSSLASDALGGFGSGSIGDIIGHISSISGGEGGISSALASGTFGALAGQLIASAAHQFLGINPDTGRIIGAIAGNLIFGLGGRDNSLSGIGKLVLDQLISGRYQRPVNPFVSPRPGLPSFNLNFQQERERCLRERRLFEDPEFVASDQSLYFSKSPSKPVEWRRPAELVHDPQLLVQQRASRFDVVQGKLGDCWLLAATAALTLREELFFRVVPPDQSFTENYAGIFHFQFWRYGQWVDVVIDDRLPTQNGELLYMHSANGQSFWSALLEKAYAKLYGSYEALKGGTTSEALEDFTGGLIEHFELGEMSREQVLAVLVRGFQMGSFFGCSIDADPNVTEARLENGLVMGHAYSITALQTVNGRHGEIVLLRIRNPWGEHEWNGPWSDGSREWNEVGHVDRQQMHVSFEEDGEFWMCLDDFHREFQRMECCNLGPEVLDEICKMMDLDPNAAQTRQEHKWSQFSADGEWSIARGTAGGCRNHDTFTQNPQYGTVISVGPGISPEFDNKCTVICAVMQKYRRELRAIGLDDLAIGFAVYPLKNGTMGAREEELEQWKQQQQQQQAIGNSNNNSSSSSSGSSSTANYSHSNNYYNTLGTRGGTTQHLGYGPGYGQPHTYGLAYHQQHTQQQQQQRTAQQATPSAPPYSFDMEEMKPQTTIIHHRQQTNKLPVQRLDREALQHGTKSVAKSASFINLREVTARFWLQSGQYVIVPSTYEPNEEAQFLLRVFCSGQLQAQEL